MHNRISWAVHDHRWSKPKDESGLLRSCAGTGRLWCSQDRRSVRSSTWSMRLLAQCWNLRRSWYNLLWLYRHLECYHKQTNQFSAFEDGLKLRLPGACHFLNSTILQRQSEDRSQKRWWGQDLCFRRILEWQSTVSIFTQALYSNLHLPFRLFSNPKRWFTSVNTS